MKNIYTDLALEERERFERNVEIEGVEIKKDYTKGINLTTTTVKILNKNGEKAMKKPIGTHINMESGLLKETENSNQKKIKDILSDNLLNLTGDVNGKSILIVGLGNPEPEYSKTRHNMGFDVINKLSTKYEIEVKKEKFNGLFGTGVIEGEKVILLKPQTFMNASGECVEKFAKFYKIEAKDIITIFDDIEIETGTMKIRKKGGAGTHNGMKSMVRELNTTDFPRVRVGTGKQEKIADLVDYVIGRVNDEEYKKLEIGVEKAEVAVEEILKIGKDNAMNRLN